MIRHHRQSVLGLFLAMLLCSLGWATERVSDVAPIKANFPPERPLERDFLGSPIVRGTLDRRAWSAGQPLSGLALPTPVLIAAGNQPGPTMCLTGAVHGDELNGVEIIRRIMFALDTENLHGTVIAVPIVNLYGFQRNSRYLPDRRDLNRYFPGNPSGSSAARIAHHLFQDVIGHCNVLIDIHTGSFHRTNLPQLRADLSNPHVAKLSQLFDNFVVLHSLGTVGTLRRAAVEAGIPAVTLEAGEPLYLQPEEVAQGVRGVLSALRGFGMMGEANKVASSQQVFYESVWLRADQGGVLFSEVKVGDSVTEGDILGSVTDPITNRSSVIRAHAKGTVIGMALNQMVMPGFAAYHVGLDKSEGAAVEKAAEGAANAALETVRKAVQEVAKEAAETASQSGDDPQAVNEAARKAAEEATQSVISKDMPVGARGEDTSEQEPAAPEPDENPE